MAGLTMRDTAIHAPAERRKPPEARPKLVEATVSLMGRTYSTAIREGASAEQLIEQVARENGGYVTKKFYPEFNTSEIVAVKIGNEMLVKSTESGIHFSLGESGIPIALVEGQEGPGTGIVFPNAEELRVGRNTRNIALWTTSANFDPGSISDIDGIYAGKGGVRLSGAARDEVSKAHGGCRSDKLLLEDNVLVLNKDSGELLTAAEHASRMQDAFMPAADGIALGMPSYAAQSPAREAPSPAASLFDGVPGRIDSIIIRTFDGMLADAVKIRFNPIPSILINPAPESGILEPPLSAQRRIHIPRLEFTLLSFGSRTEPRPAAGEAQASAAPVQAPLEKPDPALAPQAPSVKLAAPPHVGGFRPPERTAPTPQMHLRQPVGATAGRLREPARRDAKPAISPHDALGAWSKPRSIPLSLPVPSGTVPLQAPKAFDAVPGPSPAGLQETDASPPKRKRRRRTLPAMPQEARMPPVTGQKPKPARPRSGPAANPDSGKKVQNPALRSRPAAASAAPGRKKRKKAPTGGTHPAGLRRTSITKKKKTAASRRRALEARKPEPDALQAPKTAGKAGRRARPPEPKARPEEEKRRRKRAAMPGPSAAMRPKHRKKPANGTASARRARERRRIARLLIGLFSRKSYWKSFGRKFRMKKNSAP